MPDNIPMSQDDIDALLEQMGVVDPAAAASPKPATTAMPTSSPASSAVPPSQGDAPRPASSTSAATVPVTAVQAAPATEAATAHPTTGAHPTEAATPSAALTRSQSRGDGRSPDAIDQLLAAVETKSQQTVAQTTTAAESGESRKAVSAAVAKPPAPAPAPAPPAAPAAPAASQPTGPLSQEDIDRLLAELGANVTVRVEGKPGTKAGPGGTKTIAGTKRQEAPPGTKRQEAVPSTKRQEAPAGTKPVAKPVEAPPASAAAEAAKSLDTRAMTAESPQPAGSAASATRPMPAAPTLSLSTEELDALVAKQTGGDTQTGTEMIAQSDIDALVQQLASANPADQPVVTTGDISKHDGEIDKLLAQSAPPSATADSVDVKKILGIAPTPLPQHGPAPMVVPVSAPVDLRGARWLLAAAVLMLATCAGTLFFVVRAMGGLADELKRERVAQLTPTDAYGDDLRAAQARLVSPTEMEAVKAVQFLERLKLRHPSHRGEVALVLARHHRAAGRHAKAAEEFADAFDADSSPGDPRLRLEYSDSLARQGEHTRALSELYLLLSSEGAWLAERDQHGVQRTPEELQRNRAAVQDAYLALGKLIEGRPIARLDRGPAPDHRQAGPAAAGSSPAAHAAPAPAAGAHASAPAAGGGGH